MNRLVKPVDSRYSSCSFPPNFLTILVMTICVLADTLMVHAKPNRPNVVVLLSDDLGSQDIGCYGGPVKTPALDALAANGARFTNFYSGAPVCSTARATLLTGRHHLRTGVYTVIQDHIHNMHLLKSEVTIAEILKENGYDTVHLGKWHLGTPFRGWEKPWIDEHGFDYWFATDLNAAPSHRNPVNFWRNRERVGDTKGYACQLVVDEAINWLSQKRDADKPFFLNVWFHEPHAPLAAPDDLVSQYGDLKDPAAIYSGTIANTDRAIARLIDKLDKMNALDNTIVVYTSDHGSYRQERNGNLRGQKGSLFDGGIRVPGIVHWPKRIEAGHIPDAPAGAVDLVPTICGLAGIEIPSDVHLDGADLSPLLIGDQSNFKRQQLLSWHSPASQPAMAIRDGNYSLVGWRESEYPKDQQAIQSVMNEMRVIMEKQHRRKLTRSELWLECYNSPLKTPEWIQLREQFVALNTFQESWIPLIKSGSGGISRFELYDLSIDPSQSTNVAEQLPEIARRLRRAVLEINASVLAEAPTWGKFPSEIRQDFQVAGMPTEALDESRFQDKDKLHVHRLESSQRAAFDAFAYVNRIPLEPEADETQEDLAGRILGRLANQEGRVLVKLPPGMNRLAYRGFKIALGSETGQDFRYSCVACHDIPDFAQTTSKPPIPSLRNRLISREELRELLKNEAHCDIELDDDDVERLQAFLQSMLDVPDAKFRDLILKATALDTSGDIK